MTTKTLNAVPKYCLYLLLLFTPLARGAVQPWAVTVIHIVTVVALTAFALERTLTGTWGWVRTPLDKPIAAALVLAAAATAVSRHVPTSLWAVLLLLDYVALFYLTIHTSRTRADVRRLVFVVTAAAAFLALFGLAKYFGWNPIEYWQFTDIDQSPDRLSATYGNADHLAGYMEMALPLVLGLLLLGFGPGGTAAIVALSLGLLAALILSLSRGGWFGGAAALLFFAAALFRDRRYAHRRLVAGTLVGVLAAGFIVLSTTPVVDRILTITQQDPETTLHSRLIGWRGTVAMIRDHPLLGTGPGTYAQAFTRYQPPGLSTHRTMAHSDYLHLAAEAGLGVGVLFLWFAGAFYRRGFQRLSHRSRLTRGTTLGAMAGVTAILVHSLADFNLHIPANALLFAVLAALAVAPRPTSR